MTRDDYIDMCIKASIKIGKFLRVNDVIWKDDELVMYKGIKYYPYSYILRFDRKGKALHIAELHSLKTSSVVFADIDKVSFIEGGDTDVN